MALCRRRRRRRRRRRWQQFFQPLLLRNYCTEYFKIVYTASLYKGLKNSSFHVDPTVDVDFIGL